MMIQITLSRKNLGSGRVLRYILLLLLGDGRYYRKKLLNLI